MGPFSDPLPSRYVLSLPIAGHIRTAGTSHGTGTPSDATGCLRMRQHGRIVLHTRPSCAVCYDRVVRPSQSISMECASCSKVLSCDGRPPEMCGGCYSPRAAYYCGEMICAPLVDTQPHTSTTAPDVVCCRCCADPRTGVACQRQHWASHKRQCRALAEVEFHSCLELDTQRQLMNNVDDPQPAIAALLTKCSAITWTLRSNPYYANQHHVSLVSRGALVESGRPAPGDTKETLTRLLKRAATEIPWPELPGGTEQMFCTQMRALIIIADFGEPEAAIEIMGRHVEDVERHVVARKFVVAYLICRSQWSLLAALKAWDDKEKTAGYVAEAKGLMERATRSLPGLQLHDWDAEVSEFLSMTLKAGLTDPLWACHLVCGSCVSTALGS
jgi:hypothetical protein